VAPLSQSSSLVFPSLAQLLCPIIAYASRNKTMCSRYWCIWFSALLHFASVERGPKGIACRRGCARSRATVAAQRPGAPNGATRSSHRHDEESYDAIRASDVLPALDQENKREIQREREREREGEERRGGVSHGTNRGLKAAASENNCSLTGREMNLFNFR